MEATTGPVVAGTTTATTGILITAEAPVGQATEKDMNNDFLAESQICICI